MDPIGVILTREIIEIENITFCKDASAYLTEIVNFSTHVFHLFLEEEKGKFHENENVALPMLLFQMIELIDGIQVLTEVGLMNPCTFLVRGLFETYLSIRLLLEEKDLFVERSLIWLLFCVHNNIDFYIDFRDGNFEKTNQENEIKINVDFNEIKNISTTKINNLEELLKRDQFAVIEEKYCKKNKPNNWFQLVNPKLNRIRDVAIKFKCDEEYKLIYKNYSKIMHGNDYQRFVKRMDPKLNNKYILRDRSLIKEIPGWTGNWAISIFNMVFDTFMPEKKQILTDWYNNDLNQNLKDIWNGTVKFE